MRRSPEEREDEKLKRDFEKAARDLGKVLVRHYMINGDISGIKQDYIWQESESDDWDNGGWSLRISHPNLGEIQEKMK
mgnify:CR=1 FL=1